MPVRFDVIGEIFPRPGDAEKETAIVSGCACEVAAGRFSAGEIVFFLGDGARLLDVDGFRKWTEAVSRPGIFAPNEYVWEFPYQEALLGDVRADGVVDAGRGDGESGLVLKLVDLGETLAVLHREFGCDFRRVNRMIADPDRGEAFLGKWFGVGR